MPLSPLFELFSLPGLKLDNRLVMAPMTRSLSPGGMPGDDVVSYYRRQAGNDENVPRFHDDDALAGWRRVVDAVHKAGGKIVLHYCMSDMAI